MKVSFIPLQEIKTALGMVKELQNYKSQNWAIGLNGDTFEPDGFLRFFTQRGLAFKYYVNNKGVSVGSVSAYDENITTLNKYIDTLRSEEYTAADSTIKEIKAYKSKFWAIGLNGDTLQPDEFNTFFAARELPFKPFIRSQVSIGEESAYNVNIETLESYIKSLGYV